MSLLNTSRLIPLLATLLLAICLGSCTQRSLFLPSGEGKRPIYAPLSALDDIQVLPPQPVAESGPIFLLDTLFFMVEQYQGIHVFSVADPAEPVALAFWQIPALTGFTISNGRLFADSWRDLIVLDITNIADIQLLSRQSGTFSPLLFPPLFNGIFECVDESKGAVVGWEDAFLEEAYCFTN